MNTLGEELIFLISQPRAGSTMLQRILAAHSEIATASEPWLMLHPIYALRTKGHTAEYDSDWAYSALQTFLEGNGPSESVYDEALRSFAAVLYGSKLENTGKRLFLDKTPRYYFIIPELRRIFPEAKFIFLIRNPLAVLSSILSTWIGTEWHWLTACRHDLLTAPQAIVAGIDLLSSDAIVVHYEQLVTAPVETAETICHQLRIEYEPGMIQYGTAEIQRYELGDQGTVYGHVRPVTASLDRWVDLANQPQTRRFVLEYLDILGPALLSRLGYSYESIRTKLMEREVENSTPTVGLDIVVRPRSSWSKREHLQYRTAAECQRHGAFAGRVRVLRWGSRSALRRIPFPRPI